MALAGVVVVLIGALRYQSGVIDELEITTKQQERNNEIERIATENAESVKTIIKTQPCAHTRLPQSVLDRLHKENHD